VVVVGQVEVRCRWDSCLLQSNIMLLAFFFGGCSVVVFFFHHHYITFWRCCLLIFGGCSVYFFFSINFLELLFGVTAGRLLAGAGEEATM
jgi:hypothetical protein